MQSYKKIKYLCVLQTQYEMKKEKRTLLILLALFVVMMSIPWLVPHTAFLALFGFVPLLCMDYIADNSGIRRFWLWHYSAFVLWNAATTFWVCNATVGGGLFAIFANALQMSLIFGLFRFSKKRFRGVLPYLFLAAAWIAWERFYFSAQISWPWLVLGNAFARSTGLVQWYEYSGSLGGSLWIWMSNLAVFGLMRSLSEGSFFRWNGKARISAMVGSLLVIFAPMICSAVIGHKYEEKSEGKLEVLIGQPSLDPYQKFQKFSQDEQTTILLNVFEQGLADSKEGENILLLAPETFTNDIYVGSYAQSNTWRRFLNFLREHEGTGIIFGASAREFYMADKAENPNDYDMKEGRWMRSHNSALSLNAEGRTEIYHKSKLVVGTELTPYPELILPLAKKLGVGIGRCVGQDEISLLHFGDIPLGSIICYESIYGEFCTGYVNKGAKALTIITNDAWWGNTPGYRQHLSYACLRAIELRRDIARCGNTGISAFIDQKGRIVQSSPWWEEASLRGSLNLNSELSFFARHGDIPGRICSFIFVLMLLTLIVRLITPGKGR